MGSDQLHAAAAVCTIDISVYPPCRYIFGANVKRGEEGTDVNEKVSMTSPVRMEMPEDTASENVSMTTPVRMEIGEGGGSSSEAHTYKSDPVHSC